MAGGALTILVAHGFENIYLCGEPQITFFKIVYRRYTNFAIEPIAQKFTSTPNFGKKYSCFISKSADLVGQVYIVITLPQIRAFSDSLTQFAWVKRIGFAMIKSVEIEINGMTIDFHYGEWLSIWAELTGQLTGSNSRGYNIMIGNTTDMYNFTSTKNQTVLYVPLYFWFCKSSGNLIPLVSLQYSDVKINVEFQEVQNCYRLTPSHYIQCRDDIVNFIQGEYIQQNINGVINAGIFASYDINYKRLYYYKITSTKLTSYPVALGFDSSNNNITQINQLLSSSTGLQYQIIGQTSGYATYAQFNCFTTTYQSNLSIRNLNLVDSYILVHYYFLDDDERLKFANSRHDYLIEQLYTTPNVQITGNTINANVSVDHPCKFLVWLVQMDYIAKALDYYNYTDSYINKVYVADSATNLIVTGDPTGSSLITTETLLLNGNTRLSLRDKSYFDTCQIIQHLKTNISKGLNLYSFASYPLMLQPSGSCNMSQIDLVQVQMNFTNTINVNNPASFRCYGISYNVLRIVNGLAGLVFTNV